MSQKNVKINDLKSGMIIARPVLDFAGTVLMQPGKVVDEKIIAQLKKRKVSMVCVEEEKKSVRNFTPEQLELLKKKINEKIDLMFSQHKDHPIMLAIAEATKKYLINKL